MFENDTTPPADGSTPPATPAAAAATPPADAPLIQPGSGGGDLDWLPEKFRVNGEDGKFDEGASARKLAESYKALEAHKGTIPNAPATPADYKLEAPKDAEGKPIEGIDMEAFVADPMFKGIAEKAHAAGMSNEQLQTMVGEYLKLAPQLFAADKTMSADEARTELRALWATDADMTANLGLSGRAVEAFGNPDPKMPGSVDRLFAKYGTDPDFIALTARIGAELKEDKPVGGGLGSPGASDEAIDTMMKSPAYWNAADPAHEETKRKVAEHFARKYGAGKVA